MQASIYNFFGAIPDVAILLLCAASFGGLGAGVALLSNRKWFRRWPQHSTHEDKLADMTHTSMLGFAAFVLALSVTNGLSVLSKVEDSARLEAVEIRRMGRELDALGPTGEEAKRALAAYVQHVVDDEWPRLGRAPNSLSPLVQQDLNDMWKGVRAVQQALAGQSSNIRDDLSKYLIQIEQLRMSRLAAATSNVPNIFWAIIVLFVVSASFLSGREAPGRFGSQINAIQMSAIGLVVGLTIVLGNPFRGETSVSADIISQALP